MIESMIQSFVKRQVSSFSPTSRVRVNSMQLFECPRECSVTIPGFTAASHSASGIEDRENMAENSTCECINMGFGMVILFHVEAKLCCAGRSGVIESLDSRPLHSMKYI